MSVNRPITIVGGGLAGLALAAGLRRSLVPVTVHEAGSYPRHRVCGEFLSGLRQETLKNLGIESCFDDAASHNSVRWFQKGARISDHQLPEPAMALSRYRLDRRLCEHVRELGALVIEKSRLPHRLEEGTVWAAGRVPRKGEWIGLKCHVTGGLELESELEMHLGTNGYVGMAEVEDGRINVCGLFRLDRSLRGSKAGALLLSYLGCGGHSSLVERLLQSTVDEESCCAMAGFALGWQRETPGQLAIGDAEAMIAPFTGNGMTMAFQSAELAVPLLVDWSRGRLTWQNCQSEIREKLQGMFRRRMVVSCAVNPLLVRPVAQKWIGAFARRGLVPVRSLLELVR
jgi:menaquinone-9 beta-reductase